MAQAQRVVEAISTILPRDEGPKRFLQEREAGHLAQCCEEWLRSVAAEEWSVSLLAALPDITTACLNALLLAMIQNPPVGPYGAPPVEGYDGGSGGAPYGAFPSGAPGGSSGGDGAAGLGLYVPEAPSGDVSASPEALNIVTVLRRGFGNRASELIGAMSLGGRTRGRITGSSQKQRYLMSDELQAGLSQLGLDLPLGTLQAHLVELVGKAEPLHLGDLDNLLAPSFSKPSPSNRFSEPSPYARTPSGQTPAPFTGSGGGGGSSTSGISSAPGASGGPWGIQRTMVADQPEPPPLGRRLASLAATASLLGLGGDDTPAPELAKAMVRRLEDFGVGLESAFNALNVGGASSGVDTPTLIDQLHRVFRIKYETPHGRSPDTPPPYRRNTSRDFEAGEKNVPCFTMYVGIFPPSTGVQRNALAASSHGATSAATAAFGTLSSHGSSGRRRATSKSLMQTVRLRQQILCPPSNQQAIF